MMMARSEILMIGALALGAIVFAIGLLATAVWRIRRTMEPTMTADELFELYGDYAADLVTYRRARKTHQCDEGHWLWRCNFKCWRNGKWRQIKFSLMPPLNPYDPPHDQWMLLLLAFGVTIRIDYSPSGPWCMTGWLDGQHLGGERQKGN